jgi:hypothetical protein
MTMSDEISPERERLVTRLGKALNDKMHVEKNDSHSPEDRMHADEKVNEALEAVRTDKAEEKTQADELPAA